jgi:molybdopterin-guanine dinucleotide biosynthesis protein A
MGGGDKPLRAVGGRSILQRVIDTMAPQCAGLVLNANGDPTRFGALGWPVVPDDVPGFAGPLAGILAALDHAARDWPQVTHVVSVAADSPFLPADLVARLEEGRKAAGADLACAASDGQSHPVIGLWPVALRAELRHALVVEDIRKIDRFTGRYRLATVEWNTDPVDPFFNANTPEDIALADDLASRHAGL